LATPEPMLAASGLRAGYGPLQILRDVSLSAAPGEVVGIFGRNGAGKTTLLEALSGVLPLQAGTVRLDGEDVSGKPAHVIARRGLALVPQWRGLFPGLSTRDNLRLACRGMNRAAAKARVEAMVERFPALEPRLHIRAGAMSGGEQQILAIAKALIREPRVLLLDEPSIGLAPIIVSQVAEVIQGLRSADRVIILAEQRLDWALGTVGRGYVIEKGELARELHPDNRSDWEATVEEVLGTRITETH
jgi:branched-chain amino acid transport system ATP-binding protein